MSRLSETLSSFIGPFSERLPNSHLNNFVNATPAIVRLLEHNECAQIMETRLLEAKTSDPLDSRLSNDEHMFLVFMALTQSAMCRPPQVERGDFPDPQPFQDHRTELLDCFKAINFTQERVPTFENVGSVYALSAFAFRLWRRLNYFVNSLSKFERPLNFNMQSGDRKLDEVRDRKFLRENIPHNYLGGENLDETTGVAAPMLNYLRETHSEDFREVTIRIGKTNAKLGDHRARSEDTADNAKQTEDAKRSVLSPENQIVIVSDAPYGPYQLEDFRTRLSVAAQTDACVNGMWCAADPHYPIYDFYDAFSRLLFASAKRELCRTHQLTLNDAQKIIDQYKKVFQCDSLLVKYQKQVFNAEFKEVVSLFFRSEKQHAQQKNRAQETKAEATAENDIAQTILGYYQSP